MARKKGDTKQRGEIATGPAKRVAVSVLTASAKDTFPSGLSQPALRVLRALAAVGYSQLERLTTATEAELHKLHGTGPRAIAAIRAALKEDRQVLRGSESD